MQRVKARAILSSSAANQGDNTVSVAQGGTVSLLYIIFILDCSYILYNWYDTCAIVINLFFSLF